MNTNTENKQPRSFWPFGIIIAFAIFITATVSLIVMASSQHGDLVNANYYDQEIKFQSRIDATKRAQQTTAAIAYEAAAKQIIISLPAEHAAKNATGDIQLYRPSASGMDKQFKLQLAKDGTQTIDAAALQKGPWSIRVSWNVGSEDYFLEQKFIVPGVTKTAAR